MTPSSLLRFICALLLLSQAASADWIHSQTVNQVAYFLNNSPARVDRYDLVNRQWLSPVTLPAVRGVPTVGYLDADGMYIAYARAVYRYTLTGTGETALINTPENAGAIVSNSTHIFVQHPGTTNVTSIAKATNTVVESKSYWYSMSGLSIAPDGTVLFGRSTGVSPSDIVRIPINANGTMGAQTDSPHHGDYPGATKTWVFPTSGRVVDSSGTIYASDTLQYTSSFGGTIDDLKFLGSDVPIVLRGAQLVSYTNGMLPVASVTLAYTPKTFYLQGTDALVFTPDVAQSNGIRLNVVPLASLQPPTPGTAVDPKNLPFTPDSTFLDKNGLLYLFSKAHQSIFRWDPVQQKYGATIALVGIPSFVAYSQANHTIYLAYAGGLIRKMDLSAATLAEVPFANLPSAPLGLAVADPYVFAVDESGAWVTHYSFAANGTLVNSIDWNYYSTEYIWSPQNQKMYFFRDDTSPNDLLSEEINANGTAYPSVPVGGLGTKIDSPLHTSTGFSHPIRVSPDGSIVVLGSGVMHAANTLARLSGALANTVTDIAWADGEIRTIRTTSSVAQFQQWSGPTYALGIVKQFPGIAHRLISMPSNRLLGITMNGGVPSFYLMDGNFSLIAPPAIEKPSGLVVTGFSASQINLAWVDVTGETEYVVERRVEPAGTWQQIATTTTSTVTFTDASFSVGNTYGYRVTARNGSLVSPTSEPVTVRVAAPNAPSGLSAVSAGSSQINVQWTDSPDETGYQLERKTGAAGTWALLTSPAAGQTSYSNTALASNTQYFYRLRAVNAYGNSAYSLEASATTATSPPAGLSSLSASAANSFTINLTWSSSVSNEDSFVLERQVSGGSWGVLANPAANASTYSDTTCQPQTTYNYRIKAVNTVGETAFVNTTATTPQVTAPSAPTTFSARPESATAAYLSWTDVPNEAAFVVQRRGDNPNAWTDVATLPANTTSYTDAGLSAGFQYWYRVRAENAGGFANSPSDDVIPLALATVLADDFNNGLSLMWSGVSGGAVRDGGAGFGGSPALYFSEGGTRSATTVSVGIVDGGYLEFRLRAGNMAADGPSWDDSETGENLVVEYSADNGPWTSLQSLNTVYPGYSAWQNVTVELPSGARSSNTRFRWRQLSHSGPAFDTWAVENVIVKTKPGSAPTTPLAFYGVPVSPSSIVLVWTPVLNATSYIVERIVGSTKMVLATLGQAASTFTVTNLEADKPYAFQVTAVNSAGKSKPSPVAIARTQPFARGSYTGVLVQTGSNEPGIGIQFTTNVRGVLSGKLITPGGKRSFRGNLDGSGTALVKFTSSSAAGLTLSITVDSSGDTFTATYTSADGVTYVGDGERSLSSAEAAQIGVQAASYTALLKSADALDESPVLGLARVSITRSGSVTISGTAPDSSSFSSRSKMSTTGRIAVAVPGNGIYGELVCNPPTPEDGVQGTLNWQQSSPVTATPSSGVMLDVAATPYIPPSLTEPLFAFPESGAGAFFALAAVSSAIKVQHPAPMPRADNVTLGGVGSGTQRVTINGSRRTGLLDGIYTDDNGVRWKLKGIIVQGADATVTVAGILCDTASPTDWALVGTDN